MKLSEIRKACEAWRRYAAGEFCGREAIEADRIARTALPALLAFVEKSLSMRWSNTEAVLERLGIEVDDG